MGSEDGAVELGTRQLRYFIAVAEELNFTRAAQRLYIAQQALSAQISQLEERVGARLLMRTTRKVELTPAGELFLQDARRIVATMDAAIEEVQRLHRSQFETLRLGISLGGALELTVAILAEFRTAHPDVRIEMVEGRHLDPSMGLADYLVDVAIVRTPFRTEGIRHTHLFEEPRICVVGRDHRFSTRESVTLDEALQEPITCSRTLDERYQSFWTLDRYRDGEKATVAALTNSLYEELEIVAAGEAISVVPAGYARFSAHPGVVYLPFDESIEPSGCAIAWRDDSASQLVVDFVRAAKEVCDREVDLIRSIEHPQPPDVSYGGVPGSWRPGLSAASTSSD